MTIHQTTVETAYHHLINGEHWLDNNGVHINAHGGGVLFHEGTYYWCGEHKIAGDAGNRAQVGVHLYSSTDLTNWIDEGIVLEVSDDPQSPIAKGCILERPKILFNEKTGKFVMWFHLELKDNGYQSALSGVAVADDIRGPFRFVDAIRPNAGVAPQNLSARERELLSDYQEGRFMLGATEGENANKRPADYDATGWLGFQYFLRDFAGGQMARDMTLFKDADGKAYHIFASESNYTLHISQLSDDYLSHVGNYVRVLAGESNEAPAIVCHEGMYHMITSGCTGWAPNPARYLRADAILGDWTYVGNPTQGVNEANGLGPEKTWGAQSTCILPIEDGNKTAIALFDIWTPKDAIDGRYVWLPIDFKDNHLTVSWRKEWSLINQPE